MTACNCISHCRHLFTHINGRRYFTSTHAEHCPNYKTERFSRITVDGTSVTCEPKDVETMLEGIEGAAVEDIYLTRDQFEAIPEFTGF